MRNVWLASSVLVLTSIVAAQVPPDRLACAGGQGITPKEQADACTSMLNAPGKNQDRIAAFRNRCWARMLEHNLDGALADCNEALQLDPNDPSNLWVTLYYRANVYERKQQYDRAIQDYDRLLAMDQRNPNTYNSRANVFRKQGEYRRAISDYTRSMEWNKNLNNVGSTLDVGTTLSNRCEAWALAGNFSEALKDCNRAIKLEPTENVPLASRGFVYLIMGKFDEAIADFDAALRLSPQRAFALYGRGVAKLKKGDESGNADIAAAKKIVPEIADSYARAAIR